MGLDMYLTKRIYIGAHYEHRNVKGKIEIEANGKHIPIQFNKVSEIIEQAGYWRKANAIHKWFVDNCQDGNDDCKDAYVEHEKLAELLAICETVKADHSKAEELLPPQEGFFFGGTEIDQYYFDDIDYTIEILKECLVDEENSYYYRSSW